MIRILNSSHQCLGWRGKSASFIEEMGGRDGTRSVPLDPEGQTPIGRAALA
jgi:hypothetical protein